MILEIFRKIIIMSREIRRRQLHDITHRAHSKLKKNPLTPIGVLATGSAHARSSAQPPHRHEQKMFPRTCLGGEGSQLHIANLLNHLLWHLLGHFLGHLLGHLLLGHDLFMVAVMAKPQKNLKITFRGL